MLHTFYAHSTLKSLDGKKRLIEGYFSTVEKDRTADVVKPEAFKETMDLFMKNPIVFFNHNWNEGIGKVVSYTIDDYGCKVIIEIGSGTDLTEKIWTLIEQGIYNAFSFAFRVLDSHDEVKDGVEIRVITKLDLMEVSVVTVPANATAGFSMIKGLHWGTDMVPNTDELFKWVTITTATTSAPENSEGDDKGLTAEDTPAPEPVTASEGEKTSEAEPIPAEPSQEVEPVIEPKSVSANELLAEIASLMKEVSAKLSDINSKFVVTEPEPEQTVMEENTKTEDEGNIPNGVEEEDAKELLGKLNELSDLFKKN